MRCENASVDFTFDLNDATLGGLPNNRLMVINNTNANMTVRGVNDAALIGNTYRIVAAGDCCFITLLGGGIFFFEYSTPASA